MKRFKKVVAVILGLILLTQATVNATGVWETIDIMRNYVSFRLNDSRMQMDSVEINSETFVGAEELANELGYTVTYDDVIREMTFEDPWATRMKVNDVVGRWISVDFVNKIGEFDPTRVQYTEELFLKEVQFSKNGTVKGNFYTSWLDDVLISGRGVDAIASEFMIKSIDGQDYMFLEWKLGDYNNSYEPFYVGYYVLTKFNKLDNQEPSKKKEAITRTIPKSDKMGKLDSAYISIGGKLYDDAEDIVGEKGTSLYVDNNNKLYTTSLEICTSFAKISKGDYVVVPNTKSAGTSYLVVKESVPYEVVSYNKEKKSTLYTVMIDDKSFSYKRLDDGKYNTTYTFFNSENIVFRDYSVKGKQIRLYSIDDYLHQLGLNDIYTYQYDGKLKNHIISFK